MTAFYWLRNDLRIHDNVTFHRVCASFDEVIPVYVFDQPEKIGKFRMRFLQESLADLRAQLHERGKDIYIASGELTTVFYELRKQFDTPYIFTSYEYAHNEKQEVALLRKEGFEVSLVENNTLTSLQRLPFSIRHLPDVFTEFRKQVESKKAFLAESDNVNLSTCADAGRMAHLQKHRYSFQLIDYERDQREAISFKGGEAEALTRLHHYLYESHAVKTYKQTRNGLIGANYSTKFSPWLSAGCLSPRKIYSAIKAYEQEFGGDENTYWVIFELLWRDYFKYVADKFGKNFFHAGGLYRKQQPNVFFDETLFEQWKSGQTGNDFVDANMRELLHTGFMSNRGRQNTASYLVHDLKIDWRSGAAWFEEMLIDYDVCSNWGNWLYIAGVGNDPRKDRYFNTQSQAAQYDANGAYRKRWLSK